MKVKRYIANNMQEAMLKVKTELGRDAVILHSKKIKKSGVLGWFQKPLVEIVAAIEENDKKKMNVPRENKYINVQKKVDHMDELQSQVTNIQNMLSSFIEKSDDVHMNTSKKPELFEKYFNKLLDNGVERSIVEKIMKIATKQVSFTSGNEEVIDKTIKVIVRGYLGSSDTIDEKETEQKIIIFMGPTGVGKTTTLAKLAARFSVGKNKSVGFITADTYRIAAVEQLKTYSEILSMPVKVIYEAEEIGEALNSYKDKDIILIDTAGRNHKKDNQLEEIKKMVGYIENPEIFLVMSATTGYKDIMSIIEAYRFVDDYRILFTKLDESSSIGNILNAKIATGKNLSYVTTGQSVPDDIEIAHPEKIANLIVGE